MDAVLVGRASFGQQPGIELPIRRNEFLAHILLQMEQKGNRHDQYLNGHLMLPQPQLQANPPGATE